MKDKNHIIVSVDAEAFDRNHYLFMMEMQQSGFRGNIPQYSKDDV